MSKENQGTSKTSLAVIKDEAAILPGAMQERRGLRELGRDPHHRPGQHQQARRFVFKVREPGERGPANMPRRW